MNRRIYINISIIIFSATVVFSIPVLAQSPTKTVTKSISPSPTPIVPSGPPAAGINLALSPAFLNLATDPGTPVSSAIRVTNQNNFREYLEIEVAKFTADSTGEAPVIADLTSADEFGKWIKFSDKQFIVDPNETKTIKFTISPPKDASLGYYYAILVNRIEAAGGEKATAVVKASPALAVLLEIRSPNMKRELQLVDFKTDKFIYEYPPVEFQVKIKNTGNIHVVPAGDIFVDWGKDRDVGLIHANEGRGNVLPNSERTYTSMWNDGFIIRTPKTEGDKLIKDDKGRVQYETKWDLSKVNKLRIGKYTAHVLMVYDNGQRDIPLEATVSFWVIPWKIIGGLLILVFFILVGIKNTLFSIGKKHS